jgi:hypothetical protein
VKKIDDFCQKIDFKIQSVLDFSNSANPFGPKISILVLGGSRTNTSNQIVAQEEHPCVNLSSN